MVFETEEIGSWKYLIFGKGIPPTKYEPKTVTIGLNKDHTTLINFKNPFKDIITCRVFLESSDPLVKDVIWLLHKGKGPDNQIVI